MQLIRFLGNGAEAGECDPTVLHAQGEGGYDCTLCGTTMDGDTKTAGSYELVEGKFVTCPHCIRIIKHCKTMRYRSKAPGAGQEGGPDA